MITIRDFTHDDIAVLDRIISGYTSNEKYTVSWHDTPESCRFELTLERLAAPYVKQFEMEEAAYYSAIVEAGLSLAAWDADRPVAIALATVQRWNRSLWLQEFHVMPDYQGRGVGRQLMKAVRQKAREEGCRTVICETQNTNVPAIRFYRRMGFRIEAVDISLYTNDDFPDREIAVFMKCRIEPAVPAASE